MAKLADARDSKSLDENHTGSTPVRGTIKEAIYVDILISVVLPQNIKRSLTSARGGNDVYALPESQVRELVDTVRRASDNQIHIRVRSKNDKFLEDLNTWNWLHPDDAYSAEDVVRMITVQNYEKSFLGTTGPDTGKEFHAFEGIEVPGFTKKSRERIYVKLITPDELGDVDVVSLHRTIDN